MKPGVSTGISRLGFIGKSVGDSRPFISFSFEILILFFRGEFYPLEDQVIHGLWCNGPLGD